MRRLHVFRDGDNGFGLRFEDGDDNHVVFEPRSAPTDAVPDGAPVRFSTDGDAMSAASWFQFTCGFFGGLPVADDGTQVPA